MISYEFSYVLFISLHYPSIFENNDSQESHNPLFEAWMTPQFWDKIQYVSSIEKICEDET